MDRTVRKATRGFELAVILLAGAGTCLLSVGHAAAQEGDPPPSGALVTEVPNACELLTRADAAELLGEEVGEGSRYDVAGFPCTYASAADRRLSVVLHIGPGATLEGTQLGIEVEYCDADAVRELDDLGLEAVLFRSANEKCGEGYRLWVATDVRFRGKTNPELIRETRGQFHVALSVEPAASVEERVRILRAAAERVLARLR